MPSFKDSTGRDWLVEVNVSAVKRVRSLLGVDLLAVVDDNLKLLAKLADDPILLVDVLYAVCKPQADDAKVTDEQFGGVMVGDAIHAGAAALFGAIADFFPEPQKRTAIRKVVEKANRTADLLLGQAVRAIDAVEPSDVAKTLSGGSTSSPASSASTPAPSPSAS